MRPSPKEIVDLAKQIMDLEEALANLRLKWDAYFPDDSPTQLELPKNTPARRRVGGKPRQPDSLQGRILTTMETEPAKTFTADDLASILSADRIKVANTLAKLAYKKKIHSRGRGIYSVEEYKHGFAA
jgi:hypothetical protein